MVRFLHPEGTWLGQSTDPRLSVLIVQMTVWLITCDIIELFYLFIF